MHFSKRALHMQPSDIREIMKITADPNVISFAGGMPDPDFFPLNELKDVAGSIIAKEGKAALQYSSTQGYPPLREKIADRMQKMDMKVSADDIMIISGSQQGIDLCGRVFLDEGDGVVCESPSYSGALNALSAYLPKFIDIPATDHGMDMDELEYTLTSRGKIKLIYVIPDFQNPTGRTWSLEKREQLIDLSSRFELPVIEDDPYSVFRFRGNRIPTLKSLDTENRVIYLGTFSKALCPGLRIGWVAAGGDVLEKLEIVKQVADIHSNSLAQREIDQYLERYDLDEQIARVTSVYGRRKTVMTAAMEQYFPKACRWTDPEGGLFIWVVLPAHINARQVLLKAVEAKVAFVPGGGFFANSPKENTMRLSYATMTDDKITEGIKRLGNILKEEVSDDHDQ
jgi:2-aminoadipate transaminase